jgi:hypothetical protein
MNIDDISNQVEQMRHKYQYLPSVYEYPFNFYTEHQCWQYISYQLEIKMIFGRQIKIFVALFLNWIQIYILYIHILHQWIGTPVTGWNIEISQHLGFTISPRAPPPPPPPYT